MYNSSGLIPAKFLILISHFAVCVVLLWNDRESVKSCLPETATKYNIRTLRTQLVAGLSVAVALICFELMVFIIGLTMFNSTSALLSIGGHASACILLCYFILDGWQCGWFWWIFAFGSILPFLNDSEISVERPGWTKLLVFAGISTCLGLSLPVGYNIGVVNTPAAIIKTFCNESVYTRYDSTLDDVQLQLLWSFIVSIFLVGAAVGSLGGSVLADKIGRKGVLAVCAGLAIAAAVLFFACKVANSIEMLALGRLLAGLSAGLTTSVAPMYLTELAPLHLKGATGALCPLGVTIGVLVGQILSMRSILGDKDSWPQCLAFYAIPVILCAATLHLLPESPKYMYVIRKEPQVALRILKKLRNVGEELLRNEIEELKIEEEDNNQSVGSTWNIGKVMTDSTLLLPLLLVCCLQAGQQLSGINAVFYYSSEIFSKAGLSVTASEWATIGAGVCNFSMAVLSIPIISHFNRRTCVLVSIASSTLFLIVLAMAITYIESYTWVPYISIIGVLGFVICYGLGVGPIPYFIGSELFEVGPRPSAMALGSMSNWGANFIVGLTFPTMQVYVGPNSFFIFAAFLIALFIFIKYYLPETRGKDASEIAEICQDGFASKPLQPKLRVVQDVGELKKMDAKYEA